MGVRINTYALRQTAFKSAGLGVLGSIVHPFCEEGEYLATVLKGDRKLGSFEITVGAEHKAPQADVDLSLFAAQVRREPSCAGTFDCALAAGGYLVLYVGEGPPGFRVRIVRRGKKGPIFDSRRLAEGDLFVTTLLRPGTYLMRAGSSAKGAIRVAYPQPAKAAYVPDDPLRVKLTEKAFRPSNVKLGAGQGLIFEIETPRSAIQIDLDKADDGPRRPKASKEQVRESVRWTNPRRAAD